MSFAPVAEAQFFNWFNSEPVAPKPRYKPKPPGDDLPPIVPKETTPPPPPDDRLYDAKLMRLAEILGAVHYLRELCGAQEGQLWRDQMKDILKNEGTTAVRRAKLANSFNDGYRGFRRTYRSCTQSATIATVRFGNEGATIAASLAQSSEYGGKGESKSATASEPGKEGADTAKADASSEATASPAGSVGGTQGAQSTAAGAAEGGQGVAANPADSGQGHHRHRKAQAAPEAQPAGGAAEPAEGGF